MTRIAGLTPETARELISAVRQLRAAGILTATTEDRPQLPQAIPIYVKNESGEAIPPYACMQATGTVEIGGQNYIEVEKPADATGAAGGFLFNGPREIETGGKGVGHAGPMVKALGDGSTATAGAKWSPNASTWEIEPVSGGLFTMVGDDDVATDVVRVFVASGGGSSASLVLTDGSGIAARSGATLGSGTVTICSVSGGTISSTATTVTAYNPLPVAIPASFYTTAVQESESGAWILQSPGIVDLRVNGTDLQYTLDGINWTTWHSGGEC